MSHASTYCLTATAKKKNTTQAQKLFYAKFWLLRQELGAPVPPSTSNILELLPPLQVAPLLLLLPHPIVHRELQARWHLWWVSQRKKETAQIKVKNAGRCKKDAGRGARNKKGHLRALFSGQGQRRHSIWSRGTAQGSAAYQDYCITACQCPKG